MEQRAEALVFQIQNVKIGVANDGPFRGL